MDAVGMPVHMYPSNFSWLLKKEIKGGETIREIHTRINKRFQKPPASSWKEKKKHAYKSLGMASVQNIYGLFYIFRSYFHLVLWNITYQEGSRERNGIKKKTSCKNTQN